MILSSIFAVALGIRDYIKTAGRTHPRPPLAPETSCLHSGVDDCAIAKSDSWPRARQNRAARASMFGPANLGQKRQKQALLLQAKSRREATQLRHRFPNRGRHYRPILSSAGVLLPIAGPPQRKAGGNHLARDVATDR